MLAQTGIWVIHGEGLMWPTEIGGAALFNDLSHFLVERGDNEVIGGLSF
jgi:hypothetical protein